MMNVFRFISSVLEGFFVVLGVDVILEEVEYEAFPDGKTSAARILPLELKIVVDRAATPVIQRNGGCGGLLLLIHFAVELNPLR